MPMLLFPLPLLSSALMPRGLEAPVRGRVNGASQN